MNWNWSFDINTAKVQPVVPELATPPSRFLDHNSDIYKSAKTGAFALWIVTPEGYSHSRCFEEVAFALQVAFLNLGFQVPVITHPAYTAKHTIILGPHLIPRLPDTRLPDNAILFNLEQVTESSTWMSEAYQLLLKNNPVWDYSKKNISALKNMGIDCQAICKIGYVPQLCRIPIADLQDIDVLFIGSLNKRRQHILSQIQAIGLKVHWVFDIYGAERDKLYGRTKVALNIHAYDTKVFEIVRVSYLLANQICVVSEIGADAHYEAQFADGISFAKLKNLPITCMQLVNNDKKRKMLAKRGGELMQKLDQTTYLKSALATRP